MKDLSMAIALLALVMSCSKSKPEALVDPIPVDTAIIELGTVSVLKNGEPWNASFLAKYSPNNKNRFRIKGNLIQNGYDHIFYIDDISANEGLQPIERKNLWNAQNGVPDALWSVVLDLDQVLNFYRVDSTRANQFVEILCYDSVNHIVEGRFQTFLEGPSGYSFLPDSVALTEGKFHLKIEKQ